MPNEILTRAIDAVCRGDHLTADHASAVLDEVMEGRAGEVQTAAFLIALRAKGETVAELVGLARTMRAWRPRRDRRRRTSSTRPAPAAGRRPSTSPPPRRSSPPGRGAPWPSTATARAPAGRARPTCSRRSASGSSSSPGGGRPLHRRDRLRVHVRAPPPCGDEARRPGAQGARRAHDLQLPRPAHQSRRRDAPAARGLRPPLPGDDRRGARRASGASARSSSAAEDGARRAHASRRDARDRGRRRGHRGVVLRPETVGLAAAELEAVAGGEPDDNAAVVAASSRARPGPARDVVAPQRRGGDLVAGGAEDLAGGVERARESTRGPARRSSSGSSS